METVKIEKSRLISELQDVISTWLREKPEARTVASLHRATGVADTSIRRLMNQNIRITDDSIFKLLAHVLDTQTYDGIAAALAGKGEALKWLERHYAYLKIAPGLQAYKHSPVADEITLNPMAFSVYSVVLALSKVSSTYIRDQFGARGEAELEKMLQKGLLVLTDNQICVKDDSLLKITKEQVAALLPELSKTFFKEDHAFNGRILSVEAVSVTGYNMILDAIDSFNEQVTRIANENRGSIPVLAAGFFDTLTTVPYFEGGKNETPN